MDMIKMPDRKSRYFSVKHGTRIQGVHYTPSVCYLLPSSLQAAVEEMAAKDMARIYTEKVRFVTGVPYPVNKPEAGPATQRSSASAEKTRPKAVVKLGRKSARTGRDFN
jgi:hypothetical protein